MDLSKIIKYVSRAFQVGVILAGAVPQILEDRKITLQELVDLTVAVAAVGGWKLHIEIPEDLGNTTLNAMVE